MNQIVHTLTSGASIILIATFTFLFAALISITILAIGLIGAARMKAMPQHVRRQSEIGRIKREDLAGHTVIETDYRVIR